MLVLVRRAAFDPAFEVRVTRRQPLLYDEGADASEDRPAHVRAASGAAWLDGRLAVVQDDARFVALVEPETGGVTALALPRGEDGARLFGDDRGTKHLKLDLEACVVLDVEGAPALVAFGSGSSPARERIVIASARGEIRVFDACAFYSMLRQTEAFAGSELNVEGAARFGDRIALASRGNGAARVGREPVDAVGFIDAAALGRYLRDGSPVPPLTDVVQYDLGRAGGARLTFTDLVAFGDRLLYVACAEASPDALRDGPVSGVAVGDLETLRQSLVLDEHGAPLTMKIEGLAPGGGDRLFAVVDVDDANAPAQLLELSVTARAV